MLYLRTMDDVLSTVNHTTVEALGFAPIDARHDYIDDSAVGYRFKNVIVWLYEDGNYSTALNDKAVDVDGLEGLKMLIGKHRCA
jgi:hypothetical protein